MKNPIQDNRMVKDKTFALRLLRFVLDYPIYDACGEDEKHSMVSYSTCLLKYQIETVVDKQEKEYLERCKAKSRLKVGLDFLKIS